METNKITLDILQKRYLLKDDNGKVVDTPEQLLRRVADYVFKNDKSLSDAIFDEMDNLRFLPNSPTLMNAIEKRGMLSACFIVPMEDDMLSIANAQRDVIMIHKYGGGTGLNFSTLRPSGAYVKGTGGTSSGAISFMESFDSWNQQIKQGGCRRGANMGLFRCDHPDIEAFINAKDTGKKLSNFNLSVAITNDFMDAVRNNGDWKLSFGGKLYKIIKATYLFDLICEHAWRTGEPGIVFIDRINEKNPIPQMKIEGTNPCSEQPLFAGKYENDIIAESCNLGSINIAKYVKDPNKGFPECIDWDKLYKTINIAVQFLDRIIDINNFPFPYIEKGTKLTRKIGLGICGFYDLLILIGVRYDSEKSLEIASGIMKFITEQAHFISEKIAKKYGTYPLAHLNKDKKRNATCTTIAPTGTIGTFMSLQGLALGIEPAYAIAAERHIVDTVFHEVHPLFIKIAKERGFYSEELIKKIADKPTIQDIDGIPDDVKKIFRTSMDISPEWHVRVQAAFQEFTDNAISKTVNLLKSATVDDVKKVFLLADKLGCKGVTVYRDGSRDEQVFYTNSSKPVEGGGIDIEFESPLPKELDAKRFKKVTGCSNLFITISRYGDTPVETFLNNSGAGGCTSLRDGLAIACSVSLRFVPSSKRKELALLLSEHLRRVQCRSSLSQKQRRMQYDQMLKDNVINKTQHDELTSDIVDVDSLSCPNALGQTLDSILNGSKIDMIQLTTKSLCPACNATLPTSIKCKTCVQCGWTNCTE